jgi:hypothetical protein
MLGDRVMVNEIVTKCGCRIFEDVIAYCDKHGGRMSNLWKQSAKKWRMVALTTLQDRELTQEEYEYPELVYVELEATTTRLRLLLRRVNTVRVYAERPCPVCLEYPVHKQIGYSVSPVDYHAEGCELAAELAQGDEPGLGWGGL